MSFLTVRNLTLRIRKLLLFGFPSFFSVLVTIYISRFNLLEELASVLVDVTGVLNTIVVIFRFAEEVDRGIFISTCTIWTIPFDCIGLGW